MLYAKNKTMPPHSLPKLPALALILTLVACGGGGGSAPGNTGTIGTTTTTTTGSGSTTGTTNATAPVINSFSANPASINAGSSTQLSWTVTGATSLTLNGAAVTGNSLAVNPAATTTYTLTASNSACSTACNTSATVTVTVNSAGTGSTAGNAVYGDLRKADLGAGANLNGSLPFPANNAWNTDISAAPVDPASDALISSIGLGTGLHPDFGAGLYDGAPIGIPYVVVAGSQPKVSVQFTDYGDESEPGPYPLPANAPIEGQKANGSSFDGDRHVLVIDRDANRLYEVGNAYPQAGGSWKVSGGAIFDLTSNTVRPGGKPGWTSADAAGLPIFPGLVRYEEAASGVIRHALRFTVSRTRRAYVPPATHWASSNTSNILPPMGMRVRLKASYQIPANFSSETKAILQAMKTYGMLVADNGSNWYISGAPDARWNNDKLVSELGSVKGSSFEVVRMDGLVTP
ncbi:hypothetical protein DFR42_102384 [Undibacterium pigrum]|uniref:Uncharacterized protein n=2 Tax=Undibacterium pigrum TaxID=401470 RepID=A0A318JMG7_9BURK|nr:hypothetical protein DFR42_102384 [Undibacterium pigrum]